MHVHKHRLTLLHQTETERSLGLRPSTYGARCACNYVWAHQADLTNCCSMRIKPDKHAHTQPTVLRQNPARIFHFGESPSSVCPSLHHLQSPLPPPPLHSLHCTRRMCAQGPPTVAYWAECWLDGDWGGGGVGALSPTACEREAVSCRDSASTADSVVAIGPPIGSPASALL